MLMLKAYFVRVPCEILRVKSNLSNAIFDTYSVLYGKVI